MLALVTGAGGFLGQALLRALTARGARVRALARRPEPAFDHRSIEPVLGDAGDPALLARAVGGVDVVFHLAGVRRAAERDEFFRANVGTTRLLLEACVAHAPRLRRFVLAGSRAASPPSATGCTEADPLAPSEAYGESKAEAERVAFIYTGQLPVTVARPPRIMGPGDRENLILFELAAHGWAPRFGDDPPLSWVDVDDCARGFLLLAERPEAIGKPFFLTSDERTSTAGLFAAAAAALGVAAREVPVPAVALRALASMADLATRLTGHKLPLNRKLARQLLAPGWVCDGSRAKALLGFQAPTSLDDSMRRAAAWYLAHGWLPGGPPATPQS